MTNEPTEFTSDETTFLAAQCRRCGSFDFLNLMASVDGELLCSGCLIADFQPGMAASDPRTIIRWHMGDSE